jgi:hypothetical protein
MHTFRDVIARMAVDAEFARHARAHPDEVARSYGLTAEETQKLQGLADAGAGTGPAALGARLSKSGIGTGGVASLLGMIGELPPPPPAGGTSAGDAVEMYGFNPQPEPPGDPGFTPDPPPPDPSSAEGVGLDDTDSVGYYPWPTAPDDPFATDAESAAPSAPGEDKGIVVIGGQPADAEAEGPTAPGEDKGIIIINTGQLDPAEVQGDMIIDDGDAPSEAEGGPAMIIDDSKAPVEAESPDLTLPPVKPVEQPVDLTRGATELT